VRYKAVFYQNGTMDGSAGSGTDASFHVSYSALKGDSGTSGNKGTSLWSFVGMFQKPNLCSGFRKVSHRHGTPIVRQKISVHFEAL